MPLHLADRACLHPRLQAPLGPSPGRVLGLLHRAGREGSPHLVDAIDFDGTRCRYRTIDARTAPSVDGGPGGDSGRDPECDSGRDPECDSGRDPECDSGRWIEERAGDDYRPCPGIVMTRLLALGRERHTDLASTDAFVTDAVVTPEGLVRIAVRDAGRRSARWIEA